MEAFMGKINLDVQIAQPVREPRGVAQNALVGSIYAKGQARAALGQAVAGIGGQTMQIAAAYAEKNRKSDMQADRSSYEQYKDQTYRQAELDASKTSDPDMIRAIYDNAANDVQSWVGGSSEGVPNIRWRDQIPGLQADADMTNGKFQFMASTRIAEASRQITNTRSARLQAEAEMSGDFAKINEALQMRVDNGTITKEIKEEELITSMRRSDEYIASTNLQRIEAMSPEMATDAADLYKEEFAHQYPNLDEQTRLQYQAAADQAVNNSKTRARRAEIEATKEANDGFIDWQLANPDRQLTFNEARDMFPDMASSTLLEMMREEQKVAQMRGNAEMAAGEAQKLLADIQAFDWDADADHSGQLELSSRIRSLPSEWSGYLSKVFNEQREGTAPNATEYTKVKAEVVKEISNVMEGLDFAWLWGPDAFDEKEKAFYKAKELDIFLDWAKKEPRTAEDLTNYMNTGRMQAIKDAKTMTRFKEIQSIGYEKPDVTAGPQVRYVDKDLKAAAQRQGYPVK
jgi:hypothetical protein